MSLPDKGGVKDNRKSRNNRTYLPAPEVRHACSAGGASCLLAPDGAACLVCMLLLRNNSGCYPESVVNYFLRKWEICLINFNISFVVRKNAIDLIKIII